MHILSILLFAISSNLDNLTVGIGYGMEKIEVNPLSNLIISLISAIGTFISMYLGTIVLKFLNKEITNLIGSGILIAIGLFFCYQFFKSKDVKNDDDLIKNPKKADKDNSKHIEPREAVSLGFALTINNFGVGFGASIAGLSFILTSIVTFFISIIFLEGGYLLGNDVFAKIFGKYSDLISGLIIIFIGIYEIFF